MSESKWAWPGLQAAGVAGVHLQVLGHQPRGDGMHRPPLRLEHRQSLATVLGEEENLPEDREERV